MRETLQNAALHRLDPHGAAGFINGSSSTTWGVASVDLPVLYGSGLARLPPAIVASDGCRLLLASFGCLWLVLVVVPRVGQLGGAGERLGPHRALVLYENLRYWVPQGCNTSFRWGAHSVPQAVCGRATNPYLAFTLNILRLNAVVPLGSD